MTELNQLSYDIIGCAYQVHKKLGPGLLESTYETCLCYELQKKGIQYERQKELNINYDGILLQNAYRIDLLVENKIMLELKAVDELKPIHTAQLLTYMKLSNIHIRIIDKLQHSQPTERD